MKYLERHHIIINGAGRTPKILGAIRLRISFPSPHCGRGQGEGDASNLSFPTVPSERGIGRCHLPAQTFIQYCFQITYLASCLYRESILLFVIARSEAAKQSVFVFLFPPQEKGGTGGFSLSCSFVPLCLEGTDANE
jgi:hypothetical protein